MATGPSIALAPGAVFQITTCVKAHVKNSYFRTSCPSATEDTTSDTGTQHVAAPIATATLTRPTRNLSAYFSYEVSVSQKQSDGSYKEIASSWPSAGLSAASVDVPPQGATTAAPPSSEGVLLGNGLTGGMASGYPDSFCSHYSYPPAGPPESGVSTTTFGSQAPAYYEVGEPTGSFAGQAPLGIMLVIHGGGWAGSGSAYVADERGDADYWRALGWRTVNIDYRPCNQSLADVEWFYDQARQLWGSSLPYCALGASAGGNLALMLAAGRSTLSCVIDEAGPADGSTLPNQLDTFNSADQVDGPRWVYNLLVSAVDPENVPWWSPALFSINARVLYAESTGDPYMPWAQATELQSKMLAANPNAYVDLVQLQKGTTPWVHHGVTADALANFQAHEQQLVAPLTQ
jgi:hypothetical protein